MPMLIPAILQAVPFLADLIFGDKTGDVVKKVTNIAGEILGVDGNDANAIERALASASPEKMIELRGKLAQFAHEEKMAQLAADEAARQRQHDELVAMIQDTANARQATVELAKAGSSIAWGAPIVSTLVVLGYFTCLFLILARPLPSITNEWRELLLILFGGLQAAFIQVCNYWLGSSRGSEIKTELLAKVQSIGKPAANSNLRAAA